MPDILTQCRALAVRTRRSRGREFRLEKCLQVFSSLQPTAPCKNIWKPQKILSLSKNYTVIYETETERSDNLVLKTG